MKGTFVFFITVALIACDRDAPSLSKNAIPSIIVIKQGDFFGENGLQLTIQCTTEAIYPCMNYQILTEQSFDGKELAIDFVEIGDINVCLTATGPATAIIDLSGMGNGDYQMSLNNASLKNSGVLKIGDEEIVLDFDHQNGIAIKSKTVRRIQPGTYWGMTGYHAESSADKVNEFFDRVRGMDGVIALNDQVPGVYSYFEIDENGEIKFDPATTGYQFSKSMIFQYSGNDEGKFREELDALATSYHDVMNVYLQTNTGESIANYN